MTEQVHDLFTCRPGFRLGVRHRRVIGTSKDDRDADVKRIREFDHARSRNPVGTGLILLQLLAGNSNQFGEPLLREPARDARHPNVLTNLRIGFACASPASSASICDK